MNILFVSLTRFGDLLQTQAAITDVALAGHTTGVVCLQNFLPAVHLMKHVRHVLPFIGSSLLKRLAPVQSDAEDMSLPEHGEGYGGDWLNAVHALVEWREMLWNEFPPDIVINLSPYLSSRYLTRYIACDVPVGGFDMDGTGLPRTAGLWGSIMQGAPGTRGNIPYNLVDIFRAITSETLQTAGVLPKDGFFLNTPGKYGDASLLAPPSAAVTSVLCALTSRFSESASSLVQPALNGISPLKSNEAGEKAVEHGTEHYAGNVAGYVAFQLGASACERQWPVEYFIEAGKYLWDVHKLCPVLLGTQKETPLASEFIRQAEYPCVSLCGQTGLVDLSAALAHCRFLLTNDTGTMHLAAGLKIPCFAIFLATAQPFDTGPYLPGCYCFEPDMLCHPCHFNNSCAHGHACRQRISPSSVVACMEHALSGKEINIADLRGSRVWFSGINENGELNLRQLNGLHDRLDNNALDSLVAHSTTRGQWLQVQRQVVWQLLGRLRSVLSAEYSSSTVPPLNITMNGLPVHGQQRVFQEALTLAGLLESLEKQGQVLLLRSVPLMQQRFMESWEEITTLLNASVWFNWLYSLWAELTQNLSISFEQILGVVKVFLQLFEDIRDNLAWSHQ